MPDKFLTMAEGQRLKKEMLERIDAHTAPVPLHSSKAAELIFSVIDDATLYPGQGDHEEVEDAAIPDAS